MTPDTDSFPHLASPQVLRMGLQPLAPDFRDWIEPCENLADWRAHKHRLRVAGTPVFRATRESLAAQRELAATLADHLQSHHGCPSRLSPRAAEPLWTCSLLVAEDLVLMAPGEAGYHLAAASLCSPSHWALTDKFRRPLHEIHDPVPGIHDDLSARIGRFFDHLRPERGVARRNWALQSGARLFQPPRYDAFEGETFYRVERQTLRRLPETGWIVFTIRIHLTPLRQLAREPDIVQALAEAAASLSPAMREYKGLTRFEDELARLARAPADRSERLTTQRPGDPAQ